VGTTPSSYVDDADKAGAAGFNPQRMNLAGDCKAVQTYHSGTR